MVSYCEVTAVYIVLNIVGAALMHSRDKVGVPSCSDLQACTDLARSGASYRDRLARTTMFHIPALDIRAIDQ